MAYGDKGVEFASLVGKTLTDVKVTDEDVTFTTDEGEVFRLYHSQDCCESVGVEDVTGDVKDLIGAPITMADESSSTDAQPRKDPGDDEYPDESFTWTFYKLATRLGYVDIRFYGSSNGYYSESVDFVQIA